MVKNSLNGFEYKSVDDFIFMGISMPQYEIIKTPKPCMPFSNFTYMHSHTSSMADVFMLKLNGGDYYSVAHLDSIFNYDDGFNLMRFNPGNSLYSAFSLMKEINFKDFHSLPLYDCEKIILSPSEASRRKKLRDLAIENLLKRLDDLKS